MSLNVDPNSNSSIEDKFPAKKDEHDVDVIVKCLAEDVFRNSGVRLSLDSSLSPKVFTKGNDSLDKIQQASVMPKKMRKFFFDNGGTRVYNIFSKTYNQELPRPTMESDPVIVWRGCQLDELINIVLAGSAGGKKVNVDVKPPSEEDVRSQVGEKKKLPEFTFKESIAEQFGRNGCVAAFKIDAKYLAQGSISESGVICNSTAPVELVGWKLGRDA